MEDIARIGFKAETDELSVAKKKLEELEPAAKKAETATEKFERSLKQLDGSAGGLHRTFGLLKSFLGGFVAALSVRQYVKLADTWSDISARVGLAVGDMDQAASTMERLADIADRTYSSLSNTAEGFVSQSTALRELGYSTSQSLDYVEALNSALVVSGARGERAAMLMNNLSKAMAGGALRGNELNTILESGGRITELVAAEMGVATTQLRKLGADGKITGDIIYDALVGNLELLRAEAEMMPATVEDGFIKIGNAILQLIGVQDQYTGVSALMADVLLKIADSIKWVADNVNVLMGILSGLVALMVGAYIPAIYASIAALVAKTAAFYTMQGGIFGVIAALVTMRGALLATGVGAFAVAIGLAVTKVLDLADELGGLTGVWQLAAMVAKDVWERIAAGGAWLVGRLKLMWGRMKIDFFTAINEMHSKWGEFITSVGQDLASRKLSRIPMFRDLAEGANEMGLEIQAAAGMAAYEIQDMAAEVENSANDIAGDWERMTRPTNINNMKLAVAGLVDTVDGVAGSSNSASDGIAGLGDELDNAGGKAKAAKEALTELQQLAEEFQKLSEPFDQASAAFKALDIAKENGIITNDAFAESLKRIEAAFLSSGGTAEQWGKIIGDNTKTVAEQLDELAKKGIDDLSRSFADLMVDGSANFGDLAKSIIKDLINIAIQAMIVKPLLGWLGFEDGGAFGGGGMPGMTGFAQGGAFTNSVVNQPTAFKFAQGGGFGLGVMGEAGPEAVMPLTRGPDGSLGVQMYASGGTGSDKRPEGSGGVVELRIMSDVTPLLDQHIEAIAEDTSVKVSIQAMDEMNSQLPDRVAQIDEDRRLR